MYQQHGNDKKESDGPLPKRGTRKSIAFVSILYLVCGSTVAFEERKTILLRGGCETCQVIGVKNERQESLEKRV